MNIIQSIILGLVEGVTEFLPISSTFHLIFASKFLGLTQTEFLKFFEVFIQSGAIFAVVIVYFQYILKHKQNIKNVIISFVPTAIVGLILQKIIKNIFFNSDSLMIGAFIVIGIVFFIVEYLIKQEKIKLNKPILEMTLMAALLIGLGQSLAVLPGVSRAGAVMLTMMLLGYKRDESALYSFLLAVPTILAASALDVIKIDPKIFQSSSNIGMLLIGFVTSFFSALLVIKWFIKYLQRNSLIPFGIYRIITGAILLISR